MLTWIVGALLWLAVRRLPNAAEVEKNISAISEGVATLCITLVGLLGAAVAAAVAFRTSTWVQNFKSSGLMAHFLWYYGFTIFSLFVTHILAIYALADFKTFSVTIASACMNVLQFMVVMIQAHMISAKGGKTAKSA